MTEASQPGSLAAGSAGHALAARLAHLQALYDRNRFLEAYRETAEYWKPNTDIQRLSTDELVLGARLALRLGGGRLSRWLLLAALKRDPSHSGVRYFARDATSRRGHLLDELRASEADPDLGCGDNVLRASWYAAQAKMWASLRDLRRAFDYIERAHSLAPHDCWVLTCESHVQGEAYRWDHALQAAEHACAIGPGTPYATMRLGMVLLNLGRVEEAAERLAAAAEKSESYEVALAACWHLCALAETLDGDQRDGALTRARAFADMAPRLAPLADRDTRASFARMRLDMAGLADDHAEIERWSGEARSHFHRKVLANLRNNPGGARIRLPYRREIQKYATCLPASVSSALAALGVSIEADHMAAEVTFGGTSGWSAAEWLERHGLSVRFFTVTADLAAGLIKHGIPFVASWECDDFAHAVAIVGVDEAAGTLLVHDPNYFRTSEYLLEGIRRGQAPLGPEGMAAVPADKVALLETLLPADAEVSAAWNRQQRAMRLSGPSAGRAVVSKLRERFPTHPGTRLMEAVQAEADGRIGEALAAYQALLNEFPDSVSVRTRLLSACRALGNTALMRQTLAGVVERAVLPGVRSQQDWDYAPGRYVCEYADLLRLSAESRKRGRSLLHSILRRSPNAGESWHVMGDLLWGERDFEGALLAYRLACLNVNENEHYARTYCDALASQGREAQGLEWLEARVRQSGASAQAVSTWSTWISALEDFGHPERALAACDEAMERHGSVPELLQFAVPFLARLGQWERAEQTLRVLESAGNPSAFHQAATQFHSMHGDLDNALRHAEACVRELPRFMPARYILLDLLKRLHGPAAAIRQAARWMKDHPHNDEFEEAYCLQLDGASVPPGEKYRVLRRRIKRNGEDAWAWRELAFFCIYEYDTAGEKRRRKLDRRIARFLAECDRTAAGEAATLRAHALWWEAQGSWQEAVAGWLAGIEREPGNFYSYRRAWDCSATFAPGERQRVWERIEAMLLGCPGRLAIATDMVGLLAQRFGVVEAEQAVSCWKQDRPDDPEILHAAAGLLLHHGHGRTDAERAREMLESAVAHFPYHMGLRMSLASAHRALQRHAEAEEVLREAIRRHPANSSALIQMVWVHERDRQHEDADRLLETASRRDPQNPEVWDTRAQVLIGRGLHKKARALIEEGLQLMPKNVYWRERSIELLIECGAPERAVEVAREGTRIYPWGAYLWLLLGRTLNQWRRYAAKGELESCLRRSCELNRTLIESADLLAMLLVEQRRYGEAEQVMKLIAPRLPDPSPARGRLAWIKREQGQTREAREDLVAAVQAAPWYSWGWTVLMDWIQQDQAWDQARALLGAIPPQVRTNIRFRTDRLKLLEKADLSAAELDAEWDELLLDFPEDCSLHLERYDSLRESKRLPEAAAVLNAIRPAFPDSRYVQARLVETLLEDQKKEEALQAALAVWFAPGEGYAWPADKVWESAQYAGVGSELYQRARARLAGGAQPTRYALRVMAAHAIKVPGRRSPLLSWLSPRPAQELMLLLEMVDRAPGKNSGGRAELLAILADHGHHRLVVSYWNKNRTLVDADTDCWAQIGRALLSHNRGEARRFFSRWRERPGIPMWCVANYVLTLSRSHGDRREALASCRDALDGLPHDHCARYLAHIQAEAFAILGDTAGFLETWNAHRSYFGTALQQNEWFEEKRRYLLGDIPIMARLLEQNEARKFRKKARSLRWHDFWQASEERASPELNPRWAWLVVLVAASAALRQCG